MIRIWFLLLLSLSACKYDSSPWSTDVDCDEFSHTKQIQLLNSTGDGNTDFKFAVLGDPQRHPGNFQSVISIIDGREDVDFIVLLGDLAQHGTAEEFNWTCQAMRHTTKPILSVIGNHDSIAFGPEIWRNHFGEFDYSFFYKDVKFVAYNDNQYEFVDAPDLDFLASEALLKENEIRRLTIAMSHIPPWGREPTLSQFLLDNKYDLALHAHTHNFSHYIESNVGLPHIVTGTTQNKQYVIVSISGNEFTIQSCADHLCIISNASFR